MNLRKDHYRSFTRTVRTVARRLSSSPRARAPLRGRARAWRERTLLRQTHGRRRLRRAAPPSVVRAERASGRGRVARRVNQNHTTLVDGYLGMSNDEERSEMRYVVRIAEFSESSNL